MRVDTMKSEAKTADAGSVFGGEGEEAMTRISWACKGGVSRGSQSGCSHGRKNSVGVLCHTLGLSRLCLHCARLPDSKNDY